MVREKVVKEIKVLITLMYLQMILIMITVIIGIDNSILTTVIMVAGSISSFIVEIKFH